MLKRLFGLIPDRSGASAAEFALVLPLLLLFLLGTLQYGIMLFTFNNMHNAAREAARALAVGEVDEEGAEERARTFLVGWPSGWTITAEDTETTGTDFVHVIITVPGNKAGVISYAPGPAQLSAQVFMREE